MVKKMIKYSKFVLCIALILSLVAPSYAALSASDGSAFVTKAEFDSALADFNARLTTFEAGINSKIDSQVTSYLDRNGIWNGKSVDLTIFYNRMPKTKVRTQWTTGTPGEYYDYNCCGPFWDRTLYDAWAAGGSGTTLIEDFINATYRANSNSGEPFNFSIVPIARAGKSGLCVWRQYFMVPGTDRKWTASLAAGLQMYEPTLFILHSKNFTGDILTDSLAVGSADNLSDNYEVLLSSPLKTFKSPSDTKNKDTATCWGHLFGGTYYFFVQNTKNIYVCFSSRAGTATKNCEYFAYVTPGQPTNGAQRGFEPTMNIY